MSEAAAVDSLESLYRRESGRMVAVLTRLFGVHNLALAEDVVQEAFLRALEVWQFRGLPDNPAAWLMAAARNRALDVLRRHSPATARIDAEGDLHRYWRRCTAPGRDFHALTQPIGAGAPLIGDSSPSG